MKRMIGAAVIVLAGVLGFQSTASADPGWGFGFRFGGGGFQAGFRLGGHHHHRRHVRHHVHVRVPIYRQVWVAPVYNRVFVGYDACHVPIYRTVVVAPGYYRSTVCGYRCGSCGIHF